MYKDFLPAWLVIGNLSEQAGFLKERKREHKNFRTFQTSLSFKN